MNSKSPIIVFNIYSKFHLPVHESWVLPVIFNFVFYLPPLHESWLFHVIFNSVFYFLLCMKVVSSQSYWILYFTSLSVRAGFSQSYLILYFISLSVRAVFSLLYLPGNSIFYLSLLESCVFPVVFNSVTFFSCRPPARFGFSISIKCSTPLAFLFSYNRDN